MPFAFTDIEMIFNEDRHAVDWIFRYGNENLADLKKANVTVRNFPATVAELRKRKSHHVDELSRATLLL